MWQWLEFRGLFSGAEALVTDTFFSWGTDIDTLARKAGFAGTPQPSIVTIEIDEVGLKQFFRLGSPLEPSKVVSLIDRLAEDFEPMVIAVDLVTESEEYRGLQSSQRVTTVWAADDKNRLIDDVGFLSWLWGESELYYLAPSPVLGTSRDPIDTATPVRWGVPLFPRDPDRAVRRFPRRWHLQGTDVESTRTFARQVARAYCPLAQRLRTGVAAHSRRFDAQLCRPIRDADEAFLWHRGQAPRQLKVRDYYTCVPVTTGKPDSCEWRLTKTPEPSDRGSVLLLGGTYADARDSYASSLGENTPGLTLNARAVQVELSGRPVQEVVRRWSVLTDLAIGCSLVVLFWFTHHEHRWNAHKRPFIAWIRGGHVLRRKIQFGGVVATTLAVLSFPLFIWGGFLWLSWVSALLATFAWDIVRDVWEDDPPDQLRVRVLETRAKRRSRRSSR